MRIALYLNAVLLCAVLLALICRNGGPSLLPAAWAQQTPQPIAGGAGLFLMPGQLSPSTWGCYVMDVDRQTLMVYQYQPGERMLRLMSARDFSNDRQLRDFNTGDPSPRDVEAWVKKEKDTSKIGP
ncbi:MAG TPA: hypothetical protein VF624_04030 [Tepidisphaeraceae bacterium]